MAVLFTSDLHLGHKNIIAICGRNAEHCGMNFISVEEMDVRVWLSWYFRYLYHC